ncbi:MAG: alanine racemase [Verrucomicrobiae bacterium]|nr:alanine racemase [Verrucomicrobiae bacterium]
MMGPVDSAEIPPRCSAEIDLGALRHNLYVCRQFAGPNCRLMAIVKADAYGHGLEKVTATLAGEVDWFGVANLEEARQVHRSTDGRETGILVLSPATPWEIEAIVREGFSGSVSLTEEVEAYAEAARRSGCAARLHAVVDTGMGRMGSQPSAFPELVESIHSHPGCRLEGLATHFPSADEDAAFTHSQIGSFREIVTRCAPKSGCQVHLGNSAGILAFHGETAFATLARPGLALYGISPIPSLGEALRPVLSLKTRVTLVREVPAGSGISYGRTFVTPHPMRVATLAAGYADGYPRHLSNSGAEVLIQGKRCPVLGRITMDQTVVDISSLDQVAAGEEVVLIGRQGEEWISATELAERAGTIPWEILTGLSTRVRRIYR